MPLSQGQVLHNRYHISRLLGQGGFGAVYEAWDASLERRCALKENLDITPQAQRQFHREAKLLADLSHPNLPRVTDYFSLEGQGQYLVMDYVDGEDLFEIFQRFGPLSLPQVVPWIGQVCDALIYLHQQRSPIIHRDIKPANIKITPEGRVMLVDFGIAKQIDAQAQATTGMFAVTPGFSPVEQYGRNAMDARTDLYALGATVYFLLTGREPPDSLERATGMEIVLPSQLNPVLLPAVDALILRAMQVDPRQRFQSAQEFKGALLGLLAPPRKVSARTVAAQSLQAASAPLDKALSGKLANRVLVFWGVAGVAVIVLGVAVLFALVVRGSPQAQPTPSAAPILTVVSPTQEAALPNPGDTRISPIDGMVEVYIPPGEYMMGSTALDPGVRDDQMPQHPVSLAGFWLDRTEISNNMYSRCVEAGVCISPARLSSALRKNYYQNPDYAAYPVVWVTWYDATTYCKWVGRRLPNEAEWEMAARGHDSLTYPWGDKLPTGAHANFCDANCQMAGADKSVDDGYADTAPNGAYPQGASSFKILELAGNVWEWVADWYGADYYAYSEKQNPIGPASGDWRVLRGGSFENNAYEIRAANRYQSAPDVASVTFGFRCAASIGQAPSGPIGLSTFHLFTFWGGNHVTP